MDPKRPNHHRKHKSVSVQVLEGLKVTGLVVVYEDVFLPTQLSSSVPVFNLVVDPSTKDTKLRPLIHVTRVHPPSEGSSLPLSPSRWYHMIPVRAGVRCPGGGASILRQKRQTVDV